MAKAKRKTYYECDSCGHRETKWLGRCPSCESWNSFVEQLDAQPAKGAAPPIRPADSLRPVRLSEVCATDEERQEIGIPELDRVLGGGMVHGGLVLVGGDPGIGKSTLLLQALGCMASRGKRTLYVSAEESLQQVQMRARRLGISSDELFLLAGTRWQEVAHALETVKPDVLVLDSVQTVGCDEIQSATGSVSQIRAVTQRLMDTAKGRGICTFVVGHVTKEGAIAGPKVMEHMVDTVLYFEGDRGGAHRILRSHKNRFGAAHEIGVFEMRGEGLVGVSNPSELFLSQRASGPGSVVVASLEGSRPILLEVQALTTPTVFSNPRRTTVGIDPQRVAMLCAVLERHGGLSLAGMDVYVNVAGGVRLQETAADLGVCVALASALLDRAPRGNPVVIGEVGLSGEIRTVTDLALRAREASSLGFDRCVVPSYRSDRVEADIPLDVVPNLANALEACGLA